MSPSVGRSGGPTTAPGAFRLSWAAHVPGVSVSGIGDLAINLAASVIAGLAVWLAGRVRRRRRAARMRRFFGLGPGADCVIVAPRHAGSPSRHSVHQTDVAAMLEVAGIARDCDSRVELRVQGMSPRFDGAFGANTEFCVGGPDANTRTAAHLETFLPGVAIDRYQDVGDALHIRVGDDRFSRVPGVDEYVVLAKFPTDGRTLFVVCGQTSTANRAAARYLLHHRDDLVGRHGLDGRFCLVLRVVRPRAYADRVVRVVADVTDTAFAGPPPGHAATAPAGGSADRPDPAPDALG